MPLILVSVVDMLFMAGLLTRLHHTIPLLAFAMDLECTLPYSGGTVLDFH